MNAKEYLSRARLLDMQVRSRQEQILILRSMAERVSAGFGSEAVSRSLNTTAMQDTVARILEAEEELASEKPMTLPPSSSMAASKLKRVRVEGSKNRVANFL